MKRFLSAAAILAASLLFFSCGSATRAQRAAQDAAERARYEKAIIDRDFELEVTQIIPRGFPSRSSQSEYFLKVDGDIVNTRLPFFGDAHFAVIGGEEISIVFENEKVVFYQDFSESAKGEYRYSFTGPNSKGSWTVILQLYDNGNAHIGCSSPTRGSMSFNAKINLPQNDE